MKHRDIPTTQLRERMRREDAKKGMLASPASPFSVFEHAAKFYCSFRVTAPVGQTLTQVSHPSHKSS